MSNKMMPLFQMQRTMIQMGIYILAGLAALSRMLYIGKGLM